MKQDELLKSFKKEQEKLTKNSLMTIKGGVGRKGAVTTCNPNYTVDDHVEETAC